MKWSPLLFIAAAVLFLLILTPFFTERSPSPPAPDTVAYYVQKIVIVEEWNPVDLWHEVSRDTLFWEGCVGGWTRLDGE